MLAILNSLGGGEILVILVLALIVLGPEKLPDAMRKFGNIYGELRRMSDGFQSELKDAFQDPVQEMRGTAQWMQDAVRHPMQAVADQLRDTNPAKADPGVAGDEADADQAGVDHEAQAPVDEPDPQVADGPVPADVAAAVLPDPEPEVGPAVSASSTTRIGELEEEDDPFSWVASHDAERDPAASDGVVSAGGPTAEG
jgi:sec-independent protein translocase protein TatB